MIFGTVLDPAAAGVGNAKVVVTNLDTNVSVPLTTNATGYYEAGLLIAGTYRVSIGATGFKTSVRGPVEVPIGAHIRVDMSLDLGSISESVTVTSEAPILDMNTASSGGSIENRFVMNLPVPASSALLLVKLAPGVQDAGSLGLAERGSSLHSTQSASNFTSAGGVGSDKSGGGGNEWSIDGTPNSGLNRRIAYIPASETIEEVKVDVGGFDASIGHTTGVSVTATSKSGSNTLHGAARETHTENRWSALSFFQKQSYYQQIAAAEAKGDHAGAETLRNTSPLSSGHDNQYAFTLGGPVVIPKVFNGRNKLFFFFSDNGIRSSGANFGQDTVPTAANRTGDFSALLKVDSKYQIYDPLTVRPDSARPGHYIRTPFAGNIVPASRIVNPAYSAYLKLLNPDNSNPSSPNVDPTLNTTWFNSRVTTHYDAYTSRVDYNVSDRNRVFVRWNYNKWQLQDQNDYSASPNPNLALERTFRKNLGGNMDWVHTLTPSTLLDVAVAANQYEGDCISYPGTVGMKPSSVGLPSYLDARAGDQARLPTIAFSDYQGIGWPTDACVRGKFITGKADLYVTRGKHSLHFGGDFRSQSRTQQTAYSNSGVFTFSNTWTRRADDTSVYPAGNLGLEWAAFMMGLPNNGASVGYSSSVATSSPYFGWFAQEQWRVSSKLTLNFGLRTEYELGLQERYNRALAGFDPSASIPIAAAAQAAYAASPVAGMSASSFIVTGGTIYPGVNGAPSRLWNNALMFLPRVAVAYQLPHKSVFRAGYGIFYDTLNSLNETIDQTGFSRSTSTTLSNDSGVTWLAGNPGSGASPMSDPFPVRSDGTRWDEPMNAALGLMAKAGRSYSFYPHDRKHAQQQRWRAGIQKQFGGSAVLDVSYAGSYSGNVWYNTAITQQPLPQQFWSTGTVRDSATSTALTANVPNPFKLSNFASLQTSNPLVYQDMSTNSFFTSSTIQLQRLLRAFPQMNGLSEYKSDGKVRTHELDATYTHRFSKRFNVVATYTRLKNTTADYYYNEFDSGPSWRNSNYGRPNRLNLMAVFELPFGKGKALARTGLLSWILGGYQLSGTYEYQPGQLLDFGNVFYYGDISNITSGTPSVARWFNTSGCVATASAAGPGDTVVASSAACTQGFEKRSANTPATYQLRTFPTRIDGLRAASLKNGNASLQRTFKFREKLSMEARVDIMNVQNRSWFDAPNMSVTSTSFGQVTGTKSNNRWMSLQARILF